MKDNLIREIKGQYETIPVELIFDNDISMQARMIYIWMVAKPVDWQFYLPTMAKELRASTDTIRKYLNELISAGWLTREKQQQQERGRFGAMLYTLHGTKKGHRIGNLPTRKKTDTEKLPHIHNIDNKHNIEESDNVNKTHIESDIVTNTKEDEFDIWWQLYGKKVGRKDSLRAWLRLTNADRAKCLEVVEAYVESTPDSTYRMNPLTYLHRQAWNDEIIKRTHNTIDNGTGLHITREEAEREQRLNGYAEVAADFLRQADEDRKRRGIDASVLDTLFG